MAAKRFLQESGTDYNKEKVGLVQRFQADGYEEVEKAIAECKKMGISRIRTHISWAGWQTEAGRKWCDWLVPALGKELDLLPCISNTPHAAGMKQKPSAPPKNPKDFADFTGNLITAYGKYFEYIELWNEPNNRAEYDHTLDAGWNIFCRMIGQAAHLCRTHEKKTVLGGMSPVDPNWLRHILGNELMVNIDVVGIHGFPDGTDCNWESWNADISRIRNVLDECGSPAKIWITEAGFSTWQKDEPRQVKEFIDAIGSDADRVYWNGLKDLAPALSYPNSLNADEKQLHFGMKTCHNKPKLLYTLLASKGVEKIKAYEWMTKPFVGENAGDRENSYTLITGGAGFVGVNLADRLLTDGKKVLVFDNLSRAGVENNLFWLKEKHSANLQIMIADIRDKSAVLHAVKHADEIFHFAAQVAVTSSLEDPYYDFEVNAQGTLNLLEAIRNTVHRPPVVFASTNKVYGDLDDLGIVMNGTRYHPESTFFRQQGISEKRNLDFHSPYGCTKGVADQYMLDYARTFGLKTVVLRMSCIYGPHQFGTEDQGWVAHFLIQALKNKLITLYGDGKQVRDILFVEDLVDAYLLSMENIDEISGNAFNMGGGIHNTVSLLELCDIIGEITGKKPDIRFDDWRPSDQKYYVSDFSKFNAVTGWTPQVGTKEGVQLLYSWLRENAGMPVAKKENKKQKVTTPI